MEKPHSLSSPARTTTSTFKISTRPGHTHSSANSTLFQKDQAKPSSSSNTTGKGFCGYFCRYLWHMAWNIAHHCCTCLTAGPLMTVFISKLELGVSTPIYRYSLNASVPSPWKLLSLEHGEVSTFQVRNENKQISQESLVLNVICR